MELAQFFIYLFFNNIRAEKISKPQAYSNNKLRNLKILLGNTSYGLNRWNPIIGQPKGDVNAFLHYSGEKVSEKEWVDNIFVERLWRNVKYKEGYLKAYDNVAEARESLGQYFEFHNTERCHQSLGKQTPDAMYTGTYP